MDLRTVGSLKVSIVGVGCNNFGRRLDGEATGIVVNAALDNGINFFDTGDIYGEGQSEEFLGRFLKPHRHEVVIATKFGNPMAGQGRGAHPDYIRIAVEASLRRLTSITLICTSSTRPILLCRLRKRLAHSTNWSRRTKYVRSARQTFLLSRYGLPRKR